MRIHLLLVRSSWIFLVLLVFSPYLWAQKGSVKDELEQLRALVKKQAEQLQELEDRISKTIADVGQSSEEISTQKDDLEKLTAVVNKQEKKKIGGWSTRPFLQSADGKHRAEFRAYTQFDYRHYQKGANASASSFLMRRVRPSISGHITKYFQYKIQADLARTEGGLLEDMYMRVRHPSKKINVMFGQFKEPFSQEELRSDSIIDFIDRPMSVSHLTSGRTPGVMAHGSLVNGIVGYQIGVFNGKGRHQNNNNSTPDIAGRLRFSPFKESDNFWLKGFKFGTAYAQGRTIGGKSVKGQTVSRSYNFYDKISINGKTHRANGEFIWLLGPAAIRAEYNQSMQSRDGLGTGGVNLPGVIAKGYTAQATYLLTGETKPEAAMVVPRSDLFANGSGTNGWGAWEIKLRYDNLQIQDSAATSNRADTFNFGINWYFNRYMKYMVDIGVEGFKDPLRSPKPGNSKFFVWMNRIVVVF